ncbi:MAG: glycerophosphodiester phosphodiesterase family protein, partial [Myxococcota bacterium]|nr:glycerophosphodiester phosphodiesterase family protein [Myxococcota bacterium]
MDPPAPPGVALRHGDRRIRLKWHMLRRRPPDPAHARANLREGLARGAALEVDLQFSADGVGVCLHDETLDAETTGRGPVAARTAREIAALRQRGEDGVVGDEPPLRLDEVVEEAARRPPAHRGAIQLDLKALALDDRSVAGFAGLVGPSAGRFTVAGEDWPLVERLVAAAPGVRPGFEPLRLFRHRPPREPAGFRELAARMLAAAPGA